MRTPPKTARRHIHAVSAAALAVAFTAALHAPAHGQIIQRWLTQWGTSTLDFAAGVDVDGAGQTWVSGSTQGALGGANAGGLDLFLTPLSATGVIGASVQRGGTGDDRGEALAVVGGSTVFGVGSTSSPIWDGVAVVGIDALAVGYSTAGAWQSTTRFGSSSGDYIQGAAGNATNLLTGGFCVGGTTFDGQALVGLDRRIFDWQLCWPHQCRELRRLCGAIRQHREPAQYLLLGNHGPGFGHRPGRSARWQRERKRYTGGTLGAANFGDADAWAASLTANVPEPTSAVLLLGGTALLALRRRK